MSNKERQIWKLKLQAALLQSNPDTLNEYENHRILIMKAMIKTDTYIVNAAKLLGISAKSLRMKMREMELNFENI